MLREAAAAVTTAQTEGHDHLDPALLTDLRARYDTAVEWEITTNRHRTWTKGHHPGYNLATRLRDKADQVFTFTRNLAVPWTNNASEVRHEVARSEWTRRGEGQQMMLAA